VACTSNGPICAQYHGERRERQIGQRRDADHDHKQLSRLLRDFLDQIGDEAAATRR
jgi:hypothetical protein